MAERTLEFLRDALWKERAHFDISVEAMGRVFRLHRLMLFQSPFLKKAVENLPENVKRLQLPLNDPYVTADAIEACLSSLYGLETKLDQNNIVSMLATSSKLELDDLCAACIGIFTDILDPNLFLKLHEFNRHWDNKKHSLHIASELGKYLSRTAFFELRPYLHKLPREELKTLFKDNTLWVPTEFERFKMILDVFDSMQKGEETSDDLTPKTEKKRNILRRPSFGLTTEADPDHKPIARVHSEPVHSLASSPTRSVMSVADKQFLESVLSDENISYPCFSFVELTQARNQAQILGLEKIVRCIENSLWTENTLKEIIISEAIQQGDLPPSPFIERNGIELTGAMNNASDDRGFPFFRYSTEIEDIQAFHCSRDFTSDAFYFCGSLFRIILTIRYDEESREHYVGMYLQRTMVSNVDACWRFCDPRSSVNVHVEFAAGTRLLEMVQLEGRLEVPYNNKGYSKFIRVSELGKYLSPSGSLRLTAIIRLIFNPNETGNGVPI